MAPTKLIFVTGNKNKLREVRNILEGVIEIENQAIEVPEIQGTIEEIAKEKARRAAEKINGPALTEDTALEFHALKGFPGPYIKSFLEALGNEGLNKMLAGFDDKTAEAVCTFAYCGGPGQEPTIFQGRTEGRIVPPRGATTFGWDPIFEYEIEPGVRKTYAEMESGGKNEISHRYKALVKLQKWLQEDK